MRLLGFVADRPFSADEFSFPTLPPHVLVYTGLDCTLNELALELAASQPEALPIPAIGTRLVFQLVCPDLRNTGHGGYSYSFPKFSVKNLGTLVIGAGGPGAEFGDDVGGEAMVGAQRDSEKTLRDVRFVVGDYISCAVLPPLADGSVAPASNARREPASTFRDLRGGGRSSQPGREMTDRFSDRGGRAGWRDGAGAGGGIPMGEWRRGEMLPEDSRRRGRGRGR
jgi:histone deacetylase complex subunit SAP18